MAATDADLPRHVSIPIELFDVLDDRLILSFDASVFGPAGVARLDVPMVRDRVSRAGGLPSGRAAGTSEDCAGNVRAAWPTSRRIPSQRDDRTLAEHSDIVYGVSGRYASALFALAHDQRQTDAVAQSLEKLDALIAGSPDFERLVRSPVFSSKEQIRALDAILEREGIAGIAANFVRLVTTKRRLFVIRQMIADYRKIYDAARGVTRAQVTTASALSAAHLTALKDQLKAASGGRDVQLDVKVDPSIIGGLIVKLGSRMVDGSLRTKLNAIRLAMKEVG